MFSASNDFFIAISKLINDEISIQTSVVQVEHGLFCSNNIFNTILAYSSLTISICWATVLDMDVASNGFFLR